MRQQHRTRLAPWLVGLLAVALAAPAHGATGDIGTIAGGATGDGEPARQAWLDGVRGLALLDDGSLLVADTNGHRVRRIDPGADGVLTGEGDDLITTVAGNGDTRRITPPEGAAATDVALAEPTAAADDGAGGFFVGFRNRIHRVDAAGRISHFGGGTWHGSLGDGGPVGLAWFNDVSALRRHGRLLYVGEYNRVRVVDLDSGIIVSAVGATCANGQAVGDGSAARDVCLRGGEGLAVDAAGNLLVSDEHRNRVRRVAAGADGVVDGGPGEVITTVAGGGDGSSDSLLGGPRHPATAVLTVPQELDVDGAGRLVFGDFGRIWVVEPGADGLVDGSDDETIHILAGGGSAGGPAADGQPATEAELLLVAGLQVDTHGRVLFAQWTTPTSVGSVEVDGRLRFVAGLGSGLGDGRLATEVRLSGIDGLAAAGPDLYVLQAGEGRVRRVDGTTGRISTVAGGGTSPLLLVSPNDGAHPTAARFQGLAALAAGDDGSLWVADGSRIYRVVPDADGRVDGSAAERLELVSEAAMAGTGLLGNEGLLPARAVVRALTVAPSGHVYVADWTSVLLLQSDGTLRRVAGTAEAGSWGDCNEHSCQPATEAGFRRVDDLVVAPTGHLYVADSASSRVRVVTPGVDGVVAGDPDERVRTVAGKCQNVSGAVRCSGYDGDGGPGTASWVAGPSGLALDADGHLYIADMYNHAVRRLEPGADGVVGGSHDEIITTVAGGNTRGFYGDGGPAEQAGLRYPLKVVVDASRFVITDQLNSRIRAVER